MTDLMKTEMHASQIQHIFMRDGNKFYTFQSLAEKMREAEWSEFDQIRPALDRLIERGLLEHDPTYGYCKKGYSTALKQDMATPKMSRAEFDKLTPAAQAEYCRGGGLIR
jgi:hypothetical protein